MKSNSCTLPVHVHVHQLQEQLYLITSTCTSTTGTHGLSAGGHLAFFVEEIIHFSNGRPSHNTSKDTHKI